MSMAKQQPETMEHPDDCKCDACQDNRDFMMLQGKYASPPQVQFLDALTHRPITAREILDYLFEKADENDGN